MKIPFNRQTILGNEINYIMEVYNHGVLSGDGQYTYLCNDFIEMKFHIKKVLLTTSGTHALELSALLLNIKQSDEIIMPSFTFVSTANAFVLRGAKPIFCEIKETDCNIDETLIEDLITDSTKAIVPVHYAGVSCEMDTINRIASKYGLYVIEDAAQAFNSKYKGRYLGSIGDLGCYSFHETKNFSMGEGGALLLNDGDLIENAEIIREKGTNRSKFVRGEVDKYTWISIGSSYLSSDINAAILWAQLEKMEGIQSKRKELFHMYYRGLTELEEEGFITLPRLDQFKESNYHIFYFLLNNGEERDELILFCGSHGISAHSHYQPLHLSPYYISNYNKIVFEITENIANCLIRLPLFYSLKKDEVLYIVKMIRSFFHGKKNK